ncbi:hypothetical protein QR97_28275 [Streptomyces sp. PBH53]|nr:hypothetical protein QR97_28275 [Streptomyces sp. PBH53]
MVQPPYVGGAQQPSQAGGRFALPAAAPATGEDCNTSIDARPLRVLVVLLLIASPVGDRGRCHHDGQGFARAPDAQGSGAGGLRLVLLSVFMLMEHRKMTASG